ncbi:short-chain fatty acyl-CoA regulator family protein [Hyphomonas sp. WL0036]|uniref:helix-turn-helix domain-containing protein n=1 Tax=Hyphomonas sediminis TaxID=2866160 RepID=UPI001C7F2BB8|nr:short-chain fatty acyl-CoA regulator family protein [Hyphomonas sediminis]MBY9067206.1 short-chain fatty acyl-CoA regulator family protein [Hyphomonas sediminis]
MAERKEKTLIGPRVRRLRRTLGITQAQMAEDLGVSASYINLIEGNQRPISANLLLTLARVYDFDISDVGGAGDARLISELMEVLRDPALEAGPVGKNDVEDVVNANPDIARAFVQLYDKYRELALRTYSDNNPLTDREKVELLEESARSVESVRQMLQDHRNYFPELDEAAEAFAAEMSTLHEDLYAAMIQRLKGQHGLRVRVVPYDIMPNTLRYYDRHKRGIDLSELLPPSGRRFQLAFQLGMLEFSDLIDSYVLKAGFTDRDAIGLARVSLANYFAAAVLMPYHAFLREAEKTKYDVQLLSHRFGTSFEQTAHRLTTLQKPDARGIPFFFVRIDTAGNVSKRFSAGRFHFSKFGGACPLWNIHECFEAPGRIRTQIIQMPDDTTYFSIARTISRTDGIYDKPGPKLAIGLGCDIAYAKRLVYAADLNLDHVEPTPIGVNCYMCERQHCASRAHAPLSKKLIFDERARGISLYRFQAD